MNIDFQRSLTIFIMHYRPLISPRSPYQSCNLSWKYFYRGKPSIDQTSTLICHFCLPFLRHLTYFARFCMKWRHACFVTFDPFPPSRFSRTKAHCCHKIYDPLRPPLRVWHHLWTIPYLSRKYLSFVRFRRNRKEIFFNSIYFISLECV